MGNNESFKREIWSITGLPQETRKISGTNLTTLKGTRKKKNNKQSPK